MKTAIALASMVAGMPGGSVSAPPAGTPPPPPYNPPAAGGAYDPPTDPPASDDGHDHGDHGHDHGDHGHDHGDDGHDHGDHGDDGHDHGDHGHGDHAEDKYPGEDPADVVDDYVDPLPSYGGDESPEEGGDDYPAPEPTPYYPGVDDEYEFDDIWDGYDEIYGTIEQPKPSDVYGGCSAYDIDDYSECIDPVDYDDVPVCEPVVEVEYITSVTGTPECETVHETKYYTEYCDQVVHETKYETKTLYDECEPIVEYTTVPEKYETVCKGTKTALPKTYYEYEFDYEYTYVHPIVYETEVVYATPEPEIKTSYVEETVKATKTVTSTEYSTTIVKTTPVITETVTEGCETVYEYKTVTPEPVVETVNKTIYVPHGCVDDAKTCDPVVDDDIVHGGDYGAVEPEPVDGGHYEPPAPPSYGSGEPYPEVVSDVVVQSYGYEEPAAEEPVYEEPAKDYEPVVDDAKYPAEVKDESTGYADGATQEPVGGDYLAHLPSY